MICTAGTAPVWHRGSARRGTASAAPEDRTTSSVLEATADASSCVVATSGAPTREPRAVAGLAADRSTSIDAGGSVVRRRLERS